MNTIDFHQLLIIYMPEWYQMFVYTDDLFNSLEGESHYPALQRKNTQDSSPFGLENLCFCYACCLFSYFLGNFPEHVTSLSWFETVNLT